ncbi:hypothetical protein HZP13_11060 [Elizabethkingia anophelis]|nr:hypothetical protein [Elizabethkingia anophelis]
MKIETESIFNDFDDFFNDNLNERIIFSAPFGSGKSTFLSEYFLDNENYIDFTLYPVGYSVSSNEDIFDLIKADLLVQFLAKYRNELDLLDESPEEISFYKEFIKQFKYKKLLLEIIEHVGDEGKLIKGIYNEIDKQFQEFRRQKKLGEEELINKFWEGIEKQKGSIYEMDSISCLISEFILRLKTKESNKRLVLIIDDLDRLDPEHIFRLLNIFSVNFGKEETSNKFMFDKIIFVSDIDNIKYIYQHKYGEKTDFSGYIDKFYSTIPYKFSLNKIIVSKIENIVNAISENNYIISNDINLKEYTIFKRVFVMIINTFINKNFINLRNIHSLENFTIRYANIYSPQPDKYFYEKRTLILFSILEQLLGSYMNVEKCLEILAKSDFHLNKQFDRMGQDIISMFLCFVENIEYNFSNQRYIYPQYHLNVDYCISSNYRGGGDYISVKSEDLSEQYYFKIIYQAFQKCRDKNYLL